MTRRFFYLCACATMLPALSLISIGAGIKVNAHLFPKREQPSEDTFVRITPDESIQQLDKAELIRQVTE
jgi:hypothetical protein